MNTDVTSSPTASVVTALPTAAMVPAASQMGMCGRGKSGLMVPLMTTTLPAAQCPMDYAFQRIGGKHKGRLLWNLQFGSLRYGQLRRLLSGVSTKMLTQALRELEADGL
nr:hypothetical protein [Tanacetum cinerariifolium]